MKISSAQIDVVDVLHDDHFGQIGITVEQYELVRFGIFKFEGKYEIVRIFGRMKLLDFLQPPVVSFSHQNAEKGLQFGQSWGKNTD